MARQLTSQNKMRQRSTLIYRKNLVWLYVYHCASVPIPVHICNGMFGLVLLEPLPEVVKDYVMQHELDVEKDKEDPKTY
jgi:hypothetical protein